MPSSTTADVGFFDDAPTPTPGVTPPSTPKSIPHALCVSRTACDAARPSTLFLIKDQGWVEQRAKALLDRERPASLAELCVVPRAEGVRGAAHDSDGLFLLRT